MTISFEFSYFSTICFTGTDPEDVIKNAFGCFDEENAGFIHEDRLRELLTTMGDRFTDEQVDEMYREAPLKNGMFDYVEFTRILKSLAELAISGAKLLQIFG